MESKEMALFAARTLDNKKAEEVTIIDIANKSGFADFFVMASAGSERQLKALVDELEFVFEEKEVFVKRIEGKPNSGWLLMDYGDIIINIFTREARAKYNVEKVWGDCETVPFEE